MEDHIHVLARFGRTITQAEWVKELKRVSILWLKEEHLIRNFACQGGYADFSVSASKLEQVKRYIDRQEEHHRKFDFKDELRTLFRNTTSNGMSVSCGINTTLTGLRIPSHRIPNVAAIAATLGWRLQPLRG